MATQQAVQLQIAQQAAQMAQQMLQQQQPQQLQMLVAFPEWNGQDAESHISQLESALHANGQAEILDQPQRYFHLLLTTCKTQRKACSFTSTCASTLKAAPKPSRTPSWSVSSQRYATMLQRPEMHFSADKCLQDYASLFRQQMVHIPEMHENDRIRWFHSGLTPQLRTECIVDRMAMISHQLKL
jgi:hypothetical protein